MYRLIVPCGIIALLPSCATPHSDDHSETDAIAHVYPRSHSHPLGTGSVEFVGFDSAALRDIRIIPEEGGQLFTPDANTRIENVDGFWWRGTRQWFKIPDHCHTTITEIAGGLQSSPACSRLGTRVQELRGGLSEPGWVDDAGETKHSSEYPF